MSMTRRNFMIQTGKFTTAGAMAVMAASETGSGWGGAVPLQAAGEGAASRILFPKGEYRRIDSSDRCFHISAECSEVLNTHGPKKIFEADPDSVADRSDDTDLTVLWKEAGITDIWLNPYGAGTWRDDWETIDHAIDKIFSLGMTPHFITVPFGHPAKKPTSAMKSKGWKPALRPDGLVRYGVSCHAPADRECVDSVRTIADRYGACDLILDDDFRFSDSPYDIGGCFCPECWADFIAKTGFRDADRKELIDDILNDRPTRGVRLWVDSLCDRLTKIFRDTQATSPEVDLGIMVMGMGSERAGIRLEDYRDCLFRVGEWMFTDSEYGSVKGKMTELFSSLFHRRFSSPGRAFSETTIIKPLSAENYASKLAVSTFCDVRNTMFMCPCPAEYWSTITPRVKQEARFHHEILGQKPVGPFKHFWGIADRYQAGFNGYSLFLATGVPFEVCGELAADGWTFLGDASADAVERGELSSPGTRCVARKGSDTGRFTQVDETFESLFAFRRPLLESFRADAIPYVEEETPVVLGWYPESRAALLWNVEPVEKKIRLRVGEGAYPLTLAPLGSAMVIHNPDGSFRRV